MRVLIATPTMGVVDTRFMMSVLGLEKSCQCNFGIEDGSLIYMARNRIAAKAIDQGFDYILWIDSDMEFPPDTMKRLVEDATQGMDFVSSLYFKRSFPTAPVICKELKYTELDGGGFVSEPVIYSDYPKDSVFEIAAAGFGCCIIKTDVIKEIAEHFKCSPFEPIPSMGEDFAFCKRMADMGKKMYCDSRVKVGHIGRLVFNENVYNGQVVEE